MVDLKGSSVGEWWPRSYRLRRIWTSFRVPPPELGDCRHTRGLTWKSPPKSEAEGSIAQNAVGGIATIESAGDSTIREDELPMATLTAWAFNDVNGAEQAAQSLQALQAQELIKLQDAAVVSWEPGKKKPKTRQLSNMTAAGALGGTFWGMLFGLIFFVPLLGAAIGAGIGALAGSMSDVGISDDFINSVKQRVTPGTSALFLLSSDAVVDRIKDTFKDTHAELIASNLSEEQEAKLREVFTEE